MGKNARYIILLFFLSVLVLCFYRFHCPKCSKGWASAKAKVVFYYPNRNQPLGRVSMRFYGQQCRKCSRVNNNFVDPEYDNDAMKLILEKLYEIIGYNCYGKQRPPKPKNYVEKENNIQGPHEKNLCEACKMGCCDQISIIKKK